jgi:hypothetical protein
MSPSHHFLLPLYISQCTAAKREQKAKRKSNQASKLNYTFGRGILKGERERKGLPRFSLIAATTDKAEAESKQTFFTCFAFCLFFWTLSLSLHTLPTRLVGSHGIAALHLMLLLLQVEMEG